jgi:hypothetical protein
MNLVVRYVKLPFKEKLVLAEASFFLISIKFLILLFPLRWYKNLLGDQNINADYTPDKLAITIILCVSRAIARSKKIIPWKNQCLTEAITAKLLLRRRGVNSTLYLGVNRDNNKMTAHAWLCCGKLFVTGKRGMEKFTVVSSFS